MNVAVDTGAMLSLACSRHYKLLLQEHQFIITPAIKEELHQFSQYSDILGQKAQDIIKSELKIIIPQKLLSLPLEKAEIEVFSLAKEQWYLAITDDVHAARVFYEKQKIITKPSFYLLLLLYQKKKISKEELIEDMKEILQQRNWLSGALWDYALKLIEGLK